MIGEEHTYFKLEKRNQNMELWILMSPCFAIEEKPTTEDIKIQIIIEGFDVSLIDENYLMKIVQEFPLEESKKEILMRGITPIEGKGESIQFFVSDQGPAPQSNIDKNDKIDYKARKEITTVAKEDKILKVIPETKGEPGRDIFGNLLEPTKLDKHGYRFGKNTYFDEKKGFLYSQAEGFLNISNQKIEVEEVYVVQGDVDMKVGHLKSKTPILIMKDAKPDFIIESEKDIIVKGNVEGASLTSVFGQIIVEGGILGQHKSIVRAKEGISAKFVTNAVLSCDNDIVVSDSIIQTTISCGKRLTITSSEHGDLIGGTTRISESIDLRNIGSQTEPRTTIIMGYDFAYEDEIHSLDVQLKELKLERDKIQDKIINFSNSEPISTNSPHELYIEQHSINQSINEKINELTEIESKSMICQKSSMRARGKINPNTVLKMFKKITKFSEDLHNIEVEFLPESDSVEIIEHNRTEK